MLIDDDKLNLLMSKVNPPKCWICHKEMLLDDIDTSQDAIIYTCPDCKTQQTDLFVLTNI